MRPRFPILREPPDHHTSILCLAVSRLVTAFLSAFAHRPGRAQLRANEALCAAIDIFLRNDW